ncbi:MAG: helix-turn-helix transcriptional regulator [Chitinivibrionia bacterium]|nr:helix-turn-helix transcriptional regulator [Chitinivibrionia bacterium]
MKKNIDISNSTLAERLADLRVKAELTKADLAEKAGVTPRTIDDLEKGRRDRVQEKTLKLLASALGIPFEEFLDQCQIRPMGGNRELSGAHDSSAGAPIGAHARGKRSTAYAIAALAIVCAVILGIRHLAVSNPEIRIEGNKIRAAERFFGVKLWSCTHLSPITAYDLIDNEPARWPGKPWIVYGLTAQASDCGQMFVRDRSTGKPVWEKLPDKTTLASVFGSGMMDQAGFGVRSFHFMDFDHDGRLDLLVLYLHGKWYPACLRIFNENGRHAHRARRAALRRGLRPSRQRCEPHIDGFIARPHRLPQPRSRIHAASRAGALACLADKDVHRSRWAADDLRRYRARQEPHDSHYARFDASSALCPDLGRVPRVDALVAGGAPAAGQLFHGMAGTRGEV